MTEKKPEENRVFMKCRNPAKKCDSMEVVEVKYGSGVTRLYRCVKCNHHQAVGVGGKVDIRSL